MNDILIRTEKLSKVYRLGRTEVVALREASLTVHRGEYVALMGRSGSGKSTLMHLLGCLDVPSNGRYWLDGQEVSCLSRRAQAHLRNRTIGFIFQTFNLLPRLTALENVALPLLYGGRVQNVNGRAQQALQRVGLANRAGHHPTELSGGQQQRVAIARALVTNPALILADEPTGNLDSATGAEIMALLGELCAEGRTILMVTHDEEVAQTAHRRVVMQDGVIS